MITSDFVKPFGEISILLSTPFKSPVRWLQKEERFLANTIFIRDNRIEIPALAVSMEDSPSEQEEQDNVHY